MTRAEVPAFPVPGEEGEDLPATTLDEAEGRGTLRGERAILGGVVATWVGFACLAAAMLPFDALDVYYMLSLEDGGWSPPEWVHPLWVPLLSLYQALCHALGFHGPMLVPVEGLNVAIACATGALLYRVARSASAGRVASAAGATSILMLGPFWYAAMRPTPYALALFFVVATHAVLASEKPRSSAHFGLAGLLAGLATSLHASCATLALAALVRAAHPPERARAAARFAAFAATAAAVVPGALAVFCWRNGIGAHDILGMRFRELFSKIEQVPGTSVFSSGSWLTQLGGIVASLLRAGAAQYLVLGGVLAIATDALRRARSPGSLLFRMAAANFAGFALFFFVNNFRNGFVFASMALAPAALAVLVSRSHAAMRAVAAPLALLVGVAATLALVSDMNRWHDPILREQRYLSSALGPADVVLTPGCPYPDVRYRARLNLVAVSPEPAAAGPLPCDTPSMAIGGVLRARVGWWLAHGSRVWLALGDGVSESAPDATGAEKQHQIYASPRPAGHGAAASLDALSAALGAAGLSLGTVHESPGRERYVDVTLRDPAAASPAVAPPAAPVTLASLRDAPWEPQAKRRIRELSELDARVPGDPWRACDIVRFVCDHPVAGLDRRGQCIDLPGCDRAADLTP